MLRKEALNFPKSVLIETCTMCNGQCSFCPYKIYRRNKQQHYLDKNVFIKLINEISLYDVQRITLFCNNEPLLDSRLPEFISMTKELNPKAEITLSTNGILLNPEIACELSKSGLDVLYVSIPSLDPKEYNDLMKNSLNNVLENIEKILDTPAKSLIRIAVPETYAYDNNSFNNYFKNRQINISSWPIEYKLSWNIMDFEKMIGNNCYQLEKPCDRPLDQACILADGSMILCCRDWNKDGIIGNINENSIFKLWHSDKMKKLQQQIINGEYDQIEVCKDCSENPSNVYFQKFRKK